MNANQKIEEILQSINNMHRAELSPFFSAKMTNRLFEYDQYSIFTFKRAILICSLTLCLLFANALIFYKSTSSNVDINKTNENSISELSKEYNLNSITLNYYNEKQ